MADPIGDDGRSAHDAASDLGIVDGAGAETSRKATGRAARSGGKSAAASSSGLEIQQSIFSPDSHTPHLGSPWGLRLLQASQRTGSLATIGGSDSVDRSGDEVVEGDVSMQYCAVLEYLISRSPPGQLDRVLKLCQTLLERLGSDTELTGTKSIPNVDLERLASAYAEQRHLLVQLEPHYVKSESTTSVTKSLPTVGILCADNRVEPFPNPGSNGDSSQLALHGKLAAYAASPSWQVCRPIDVSAGPSRTYVAPSSHDPQCIFQIDMISQQVQWVRPICAEDVAVGGMTGNETALASLDSAWSTATARRLNSLLQQYVHQAFRSGGLTAVTCNWMVGAALDAPAEWMLQIVVSHSRTALPPTIWTSHWTSSWTVSAGAVPGSSQLPSRGSASQHGPYIVKGEIVLSAFHAADGSISFEQRKQIEVSIGATADLDSFARTVIVAIGREEQSVYETTRELIFTISNQQLRRLRRNVMPLRGIKFDWSLLESTIFEDLTDKLNTNFLTSSTQTNLSIQ